MRIICIYEDTLSGHAAISMIRRWYLEKRGDKPHCIKDLDNYPELNDASDVLCIKKYKAGILDRYHGYDLVIILGITLPRSEVHMILNLNKELHMVASPLLPSTWKYCYEDREMPDFESIPLPDIANSFINML